MLFYGDHGNAQMIYQAISLDLCRSYSYSKTLLSKKGEMNHEIILQNNNFCVEALWYVDLNLGWLHECCKQ
jgi:hypothetical protein